MTQIFNRAVTYVMSIAKLVTTFAKINLAKTFWKELKA